MNINRIQKNSSCGQIKLCKTKNKPWSNTSNQDSSVYQVKTESIQNDETKSFESIDFHPREFQTMDHQFEQFCKEFTPIEKRNLR